MNLTLDDFDYFLPPGRIAQQPAEPRGASRLLVSRKDGIGDHFFNDLPDFLDKGDLLVLNDTKVIPARLLGQKATGGKVEVFLLRPLAAPGEWLALTRGFKKSNGQVYLGEGLTARILDDGEDGRRVLLQVTHGSLDAAISRHGQIPLPPYIESLDSERDKHRYQTVYATHEGAVAAPTAGLHFDKVLLQRLADKGVKIATVTLHVGLGTFQPVRERELGRHQMHREWCCLTSETAKLINGTRVAGKRVVAVGTTVARVLETAIDGEGRVCAFRGDTNLFILPGYVFRGVSALITNFHLPRSTLLMLVAALIGKGRLDRDYAHAIEGGYRFYSYGDASLLLP